MSLESFFTFGDTYIFLVGTNRESICFYADMVAFMTGVTSSSGRGAEYAAMFDNHQFTKGVRSQLQDKLAGIHDYAGVKEVATYCSWEFVNAVPDNSAVAVFFKTCPTIEECEILKSRALSFCPLAGFTDEHPLEVKGFRLLKYTLQVGHYSIPYAP